MKTIDAVERHQPRVGRIAPHLQRTATHVRQGIAHHAIGVFRAARQVAKHAERREQKHGENASKPFEQTLHATSTLKDDTSGPCKLSPGQGLQNSIFILVRADARALSCSAPALSQSLSPLRMPVEGLPLAPACLPVACNPGRSASEPATGATAAPWLRHSR